MKSNKQVALIVKEDGLIYVNEVPEEPELCFMLDKKLNPDVSLGHVSCDILCCQCDVKQEQHQKALASAKESAIRVKHQFLGFHLIAKHFPDLDTIEPPEPGIYPIEGLTWTVEQEHVKINNNYHPKYEVRQVAILKESTPSTEQLKDIDVTQLKESQEEIFDELFSIYLARLHEGLSMYDAVKELETRFTITRKQ